MKKFFPFRIMLSGDSRQLLWRISCFTLFVNGRYIRPDRFWESATEAIATPSPILWGGEMTPGPPEERPLTDGHVMTPDLCGSPQDGQGLYRCLRSQGPPLVRPRKGGPKLSFLSPPR
jgi:hypothetical protein